MQQDTLDYLSKVCLGLEKVARQIRAETDEVVATGNHVEIIKHFDALRKANDLIKGSRDDLQKTADYLSTKAIPDVVQSLRERTGEKPPFRIENVGRVSVAYRFSCSMIDKPKGIGWLDDNGHGELAQRTVNSMTLSAFAKRMLEDEGKELPADIFKTSTNPYTSITKA